MDKNQILCMISGASRAIISAERVALNFLQTLSAVATKTRYLVICAATFSSFNKLADTSPVPMSSFNANATTLSTVGLFMNKIHNWIAKRLVTIPYVSLPNIIAGEYLVPELIQNDANPDNIAQQAIAILQSDTTALII
jgi:hypothetical protein